MPFDPFDRPIPGESLTKPMQDDPIFAESKTSNLDEAFYQTRDTIKNNNALYSDLLQMISAGVDLESIANVITFGSFSKGQYSPDVAMQLAPLLMIWMYTEAHKRGINEEDINVMNYPENKSMGNMSPTDVVDLMERKNPEKYKKKQRETATSELDSFFEALQGGAVEEEPMEEDMGFMGMREEPATPEEMENV